MVTKGRNNIKVKKTKQKNEQRLILSPHKGGNGRKKNRKAVYIQIMLEFTLIRNWFLSLVDFPHFHKFITKLPIRLLFF